MILLKRHKLILKNKKQIMNNLLNKINLNKKWKINNFNNNISMD